MKTPICDFVENYIEKNHIRLHMPGHKGKAFLGVEQGDITEVDGADSLYEASGIIKMSEENASSLFGVPTFYSTEGSSHCLRAMMLLVKSYAENNGRSSLVWAARNAHKAFVSACALNDLDIKWLYGKDENTVLSCKVDADELNERLSLAKVKPVAVYVTSPDYLGNVADVKGIAEICHSHNVLLCVDSAHGAYMRFLSPSLHPSDLGADVVCTSAHKTLPVLTGGAYLHLSDKLPSQILNKAKSALSFFGSTSPSYLTLCSLDRANLYLSDGYSEKLSAFSVKLRELKEALKNMGYTLLGDEELKITIDAKNYGYEGYDIATQLEKEGIICEFADPDFVVLMFSVDIGDEGIQKIAKAFSNISQKSPLPRKSFTISPPKRVMSVKEALMRETEEISIEMSVGRIFAKDNISCPPAIPILVCGEVISSEAVEMMKYYGIKKIIVVK